MQLHRRTDADEFAVEVEPFLLTREAEHNLLLGILAGIREEDGPFADVEPYLAFVRDDAGQVALVAERTPPHNVVLSTSMIAASRAPRSGAATSGKRFPLRAGRRSWLRPVPR